MWRGFLAPYLAVLRAEVERTGGQVVKFTGDGVMAIFGAVAAHEDDPERQSARRSASLSESPKRRTPICGSAWVSPAGRRWSAMTRRAASTPSATS